jgi:hypothetical protein
MADVYRFVPKDGHLIDKADSLRCFMFFQDTPCYRVNSLARYSDVNKAVCDVTTVALKGYVSLAPQSHGTWLFS